MKSLKLLLHFFNALSNTFMTVIQVCQLSFLFSILDL
jgi:hypothetical protein